MNFAGDIPLMFEDFGLAATYTLGADDPVPCRVIEDRDVEEYGDLGQVVGRRTALTFMTDQVAAPARGAVVAEVGTARTWTIDKVIEDDGDVVKALVLR